MFQQKYPMIRPVFFGTNHCNPDVFPKHLQGQLQTAQATVWGHGRARQGTAAIIKPGVRRAEIRH